MSKDSGLAVPPTPEPNTLHTARPTRWGRQSLLSSGALSLASSAWGALLALFTVPVMVHRLGLVAYGVYSLAFSIASFGAYLDFGLGWTTSKFVAEADAQGDSDLLSATMKAAALYHVTVGALFVVVVVPAADWIATTILRFGPAQAPLMARVLRIAAVSFLCSSISGVLISALRGMRRFALASTIVVVGMTISVGGAALAAWSGSGVTVAAGVQLAGAVLALVLGIIMCLALVPLRRGAVTVGSQLRAMIGFSVWNYVNRLTQMLVLDVDKVLVGRFAGAAFLPCYTVPASLAQRVSFLGGPAVTAIYPTAAAGQFQRESFLKQYFSGSRLLHVLTASAGLAVIFWGDRFLTAWVGAEVARQATFFVRLFAVGFWLNAVGAFDGGCIEGWNRPRTTAKIVLAGTLCAATAAAVTWDLLGAPRAIGVGVTTWLCWAGIGQMLCWHRMSRYPARAFLRQIAGPVAEMAVFSGLLSLLLRQLTMARIATIAILPALTLVLAAYGVTRAFTAEERIALFTRFTGWFGIKSWSSSSPGRNLNSGTQSGAVQD